jgi:hypothetical protein
MSMHSKCVRFKKAVPKGIAMGKKRRMKRARNSILPAGTMFQYVASMNPLVNAMKKFTTSFERSKRLACKQKRNPSLMILSNPLKKRKAKRTAAPPAALQHEVRLAQKAYKSFHFKDSQKQAKRKVPDGWPRVYVILGVCDSFEVKTAQGKVKKVYGTNKPTLACTKDRKDVFIFSNSGQLGIPSGTAVRVDYTVPPNSGRVKWSRAWYHPHDSAPAAKAHKCGRAVRITGPGLSVTPRGIIG